MSRRHGSPEAVAPTGRARALLADGIRALATAGLPTARPDAEWLLAQLLGVDRIALYTDPPAVGADEAARYAALLARRAALEPLQHLLGWEEFRGLRLRVSPAVLIPRPETELLVEWALALTPVGGTAGDVGTGSGCIACAIAAERPDARVIATELSRDAFAVAADNVARLGLGGRIALRAGDLLEPLAEQRDAVDVLVANPPYIPSGVIATLPREVSLWEPRSALDGGEDGMALSRRIIAGAPAVLRTGGTLVMEIGDGQAALLATAMLIAGFQDVCTRRDLNGVERFICGSAWGPLRSVSDSSARLHQLGSRLAAGSPLRSSRIPRLASIHSGLASRWARADTARLELRRSGPDDLRRASGARLSGVTWMADRRVAD